MYEVIGIVGTSVFGGNLPLLERLTVVPERREETISRLKEYLGVHELVYVATCNRVEFIFVAAEGQKNPADIRNRTLDFFLKGGRDFQLSPDDFYIYSGADAVRHLFRVTASLESMVVGETQITGQVKSSLAEAQAMEISGSTLDHLISEALLVARRVRNETKVGSGSLSMASLVIGELNRRGRFSKSSKIALVGSGEMSVKMASYLHKKLPAEIIFVNRTTDKVTALAERFGGTVCGLAEFIENPGLVDAIISSTSASEPVFDVEFLNKLRTQDSECVCVDLAIPRDFSAEFNNAEGVTLIDIPRLNENKDRNLRSKFREFDLAGKIIEESTKNFISSHIERRLKPTLRIAHDEALSFAFNECEDLFSSRLRSISSEDKSLIHDLMKKVVGRTHAAQSQAVASHLSRMIEPSAAGSPERDRIQLSTARELRREN